MANETLTTKIKQALNYETDVVNYLAKALIKRSVWSKPNFKANKYYIYDCMGMGDYTFTMGAYLPYHKVDCCKVNEEMYAKALDKMAELGYVIGVRKETGFYTIMPTITLSVQYDNGAGDFMSCKDKSLTDDFLRENAHCYSADGFIRIDCVKPSQEEFCVYSEPWENPMSTYRFPKHDIHGNVIKYAYIKLNADKAWDFCKMPKL